MCLLTVLLASLPLWASLPVSITYAGRPTITYNLPLEFVFDEIDTARNLLIQDIYAEIDGYSSNIRDLDVDLFEDITIELTGTQSASFDILLKAYPGDIDFKWQCFGITRPKIDVDLTRVEARATYNLASGLSPFDVTLVGFDVDLQTGINLCSHLIIFFNVFAGDLGEFLEDIIRDQVESSASQSLSEAINIDGLGQSFFGLNAFLEQIPAHLFTAIGLNRQEVIGVITNPFDGISVKITFDEDGLKLRPAGHNPRDRINIIVEVPWEKRPVALFTTNQVAPDYYRFDASMSYDPDGGPVRFSWSFGDGAVYDSNNPLVTHVYTNPGWYHVGLTVIDDENARGYAYTNVQFCPEGGLGGPFDKRVPVSDECLGFSP